MAGVEFLRKDGLPRGVQSVKATARVGDRCRRQLRTPARRSITASRSLDSTNNRRIGKTVDAQRYTSRKLNRDASYGRKRSFRNLGLYPHSICNGNA